MMTFDCNISILSRNHYHRSLESFKIYRSQVKNNNHRICKSGGVSSSSSNLSLQCLTTSFSSLSLSLCLNKWLNKIISAFQCHVSSRQQYKKGILSGFFSFNYISQINRNVVLWSFTKICALIEISVINILSVRSLRNLLF